MGTEIHPVLDPDDLNDTDAAIVELLAQGRVTPPYVADEIDVSREYASERLIRMKEHDHVRRIAPGLYELVDDPREELATMEDVREMAEEVERVAREHGAYDSTMEIRDATGEVVDTVDLDSIDTSPIGTGASADAGAADALPVGRIEGGVSAALSALDGQPPDVDTAEAEIEAVLEVLEDAE